MTDYQVCTSYACNMLLSALDKISSKISIEFNKNFVTTFNGHISSEREQEKKVFKFNLNQFNASRTI